MDTVPSCQSVIAEHRRTTEKRRYVWRSEYNVGACRDKQAKCDDRFQW